MQAMPSLLRRVRCSHVKLLRVPAPIVISASRSSIAPFVPRACPRSFVSRQKSDILIKKIVFANQ
jgi:hypothetical protein